MTTNPGDREHLEEEARERIEEMPAETALGHRDPEGGGEGDPLEYDREQAGSGGAPES